MEQFVGAIAQRSAFCALLDARAAARCEEQGRELTLIRDKTATWVSEHYVHNHCVSAFMSKYYRCVYRWNFADMIH